MQTYINLAIFEKFGQIANFKTSPKFPRYSLWYVCSLMYVGYFGESALSEGAEWKDSSSVSTLALPAQQSVSVRLVSLPLSISLSLSLSQWRSQGGLWGLEPPHY